MQDGDRIADIVIEQYKQLPKKGKPLVRSNGVKEWTILAGIVIHNKFNGELECVSMATGVKALPDTRIHNSGGHLLHDCHAEILAIRAFNLYLISEGIDHIDAVYLYICAPPCGDASMQNVNTGEPNWTRTQPPEPGNIIRGREHYNCLGRVRTKPGRGDSPTTMSKSCTDKLCLRQSRGLLLSPLRQLYGKSLCLTALACPAIPYADFERAFSRWDPVNRFQMLNTTVELADYHPNEGAPSPCSLIWTPRILEVVANGMIQGSKGKPSAVSRYGLTQAAKEKDPKKFHGIKHYYDMKAENKWPSEWRRTALDDFELHKTLASLE